VIHIREKIAGVLLSDQVLEIFIYYSIFILFVILVIADYIAFGNELSRQAQLIFIGCALPGILYAGYLLWETKVSD
jgi:hypothetical protein